MLCDRLYVTIRIEGESKLPQNIYQDVLALAEVYWASMPQCRSDSL